MPDPMQRLLEPPTGMKSPLAALFLVQLDDQYRRLALDTRGATVEELGWQLAPGANTIGMLLAHIAAVEVGWIQVGLRGYAEEREEEVLGHPWDAFGMPLAAGAEPPALLAGRDLAWFDDLIARARAHTREALADLTDADMDRRFTIRRHWDGGTLEGTVRWTLYHVLEHLAGHYGQINLLRHARRALTPATA
jgi:uncharacterized damage-inducible protein DinB